MALNVDVLAELIKSNISGISDGGEGTVGGLFSSDAAQAQLKSISTAIASAVITHIMESAEVIVPLTHIHTVTIASFGTPTPSAPSEFSTPPTIHEMGTII